MKTFIVRIWRETTEVPHDLRGTVHDVESGDRHMFQSPTELLNLLRPSVDPTQLDRSDR